MRFPLVLIFVLLPLVACASPGDFLAGTDWWMSKMGEHSTFPFVTLEFSDNGNLSGDTGCNSYWGEYKREGELFEIVSFSKHERGCPTDYVDALVNARRLIMDVPRMTIESKGGRTLTFTSEGGPGSASKASAKTLPLLQFPKLRR